jgi:hypothetical protein
MTSRHLPFLALLAVVSGSLAQASDLSTCVKRTVTFDGIEQLRYATVEAGSGLRQYLHAQYPDHCTSGTNTACPAGAYLIPGNAVAIGKECGGWDYVQYIGKRRISEGWVRSEALTPTTLTPPAKPPSADGTLTARRYHFELTWGKETPVCEAYLQRLNQTEFYHPPYCGRPESVLVPGFVLLHRRYLTKAQFSAIYFDVTALLEDEPPYYEYRAARHPDGSITLTPPYNPLLGEFSQEGFTPAAWTYDPPVNITNLPLNGTNVIMWTGLEDRYNSDCGSPSNRDGSFAREAAVGLVVSGNGGGFNRASTYEVFGIPNVSSYTPPVDIEFGDDFGIFEYDGQTFYDTFFDWSRGVPASLHHDNQNLSTTNQLWNTLAVYLDESGKRQEVCEYHVPGLKIRPRDNTDVDPVDEP